LPPAMSDEELHHVIRKVINLEKPRGIADFGKVMGKVMSEVKGKADGERVARMVKELISDY